MKYLSNTVFLFLLFFLSCQKSNEPLKKNKVYDVNITYIEDSSIVGFTPGDFLDIFDDDLSDLTYKILGYKIKYNLKNGISYDKFYRDNRKIITENSDIFERYFIDVKNTDSAQLEKDIFYSLSNETSANIRNLFGYEYGTPLKVIAENIAPSYQQSILNIWNSSVSGRNELLDAKRLFIFTSLYWRIAANEFTDSSLVIINIPLTSNYRGMSAKSIADGGFVDRIICENNDIKPCKSISIISTYQFFNSGLDNETLKNIFSYYIIQSIAAMFAKYDIHSDEKHSIMAEVNRFDYVNWYSNIINFKLNQPYKTIKYYKDTIKD
ncbi:hypothetical protein A966_13315 [Brachyspira hampsonii 30446]|uniref:Lipoprotein n=2 Tax=Brachyspira hampsonii TaxID=1287055 RepID=A0A2U4F948_9SPIR|nr:hypothetical protein [Brachyspira hampsonii]EKV55834.1 hypothetical protein A966_13315 [Brachyspira hampsonii 30446]OEJ13380.1 hypothetical protein A9495_10205 [Brachyspira hampsonii]